MQHTTLEYRRNLPHILPQGATFFVTYRLNGSLPLSVLKTWEADLEAQKARLMQQVLHPDIEREELYVLQKKLFLQVDKFLDTSPNGPYWLKEEAIAVEVADSLHFLTRHDIDLWAFCIMPNHVHVLLTPLPDAPPLFRILQKHKRHTGNRSNKILGRSGNFWQHESYDHYIRNEKEFNRVVAYIANNPLNAGLVTHWQDWKWTYLHPDLL